MWLDTLALSCATSRLLVREPHAPIPITNWSLNRVIVGDMDRRRLHVGCLFCIPIQLPFCSICIAGRLPAPNLRPLNCPAARSPIAIDSSRIHECGLWTLSTIPYGTLLLTCRHLHRRPRLKQAMSSSSSSSSNSSGPGTDPAAANDPRLVSSACLARCPEQHCKRLLRMASADEIPSQLYFFKGVFMLYWKCWCCEMVMGSAAEQCARCGYPYGPECQRQFLGMDAGWTNIL